MKMKTKLIALSVLAASVVSASSMATVTNGQLVFNWEGAIPVSSVNKNTTWEFVDGLNNVYKPAKEALHVDVDAKSGGMTAVSAQPYDFYIVPEVSVLNSVVTRDATKTFTTNGVKAYLGAVPVSTGFNGNKQLAVSSTAIATDGEVAITLNGTPLTVGSTNSVDVAKTGASEAHVSIQLNAKAANTDITEGASIGFTAPVIFAVDLV